MKTIKSIFLTVVVFCMSLSLFAQRAKHGNYTVTTANTIVNTYTYLTTDATAGDLSINVANNSMTGGAFTTSLEPGDLILIIQMQGAMVDVNTTPTTAWGGSYTVPNDYITGGVWGANPQYFGRVTNFNNAGRFEKREVLSVSGTGVINLTCGLKNNYIASGHVQIVRIPRFDNLTVNSSASIVPPLWNGQTGGIVAIEVETNINLQANSLISADEAGFRGGAIDAYPSKTGGDPAPSPRYLGSYDHTEGSEKGEGIFGYHAEYDAIYSRYGIGAIANGGGGGGYQNAGGGGGSNVDVTFASLPSSYTGKGIPLGYVSTWNLESAGFGGSTSGGGGRGGYALSQNDLNELLVGPDNDSWGGDGRKINGGFGGHPLPFDGNLIFFGGGGGAGDQDSGDGGAGGRGGGIVFLTCYGTITGSGTISAIGGDGQDSNPSNASPTAGQPRRGNDGAGGGGAGGSIHIENASTIPSTILLDVHGGDGGDHNISILNVSPLPALSSEAAGPGGSGSGGQIVYANGAAPTRNLSAGIPGTTNSSHISNFPYNGATSGNDGIDIGNTVPFYDITVSDQSICSGNSATLTASVIGTQPSGSTIAWYDSYSGGTQLGTGTSFITPVLTTTTTYYVGLCPGGTFRVPVTVTVLPGLDASFSYSLSSYCVNGTDPTPTVTGVTGGTFSSTAGLSIDSSTGTIDLSASTPGSYTVTYSVTSGGCSGSSDVSVTITPLDDASFSYAASSYCISGTDPSPTITGLTGGTFSSTAGLSIDPSTGMIDLSATTPGTYSVTYTTSGACPNSSTTPVTINALDDASFSYAASSYCTSATDPSPTITGLTGGTFSSTAGLSIDSSTGVIDVSASALGTYTVTYATSGPCPNSSTTSITINALDDASFNYSAASYCVNDADPTPMITGVTGGTFSSSAGLSINPSTGVIDVSASTPGTYTVTYSTSGVCANSSDVSVTINPMDDASFSYSAASYCMNATDPSPTVTGLAGGTFSSTTGLSIDPSTGVIDVSTSTPGTYTVTYTTSGVCANSSDVSVTINPMDDASFSYSAASYCIAETDPTPTITGLTGGTFSSTAGLSIDPSTGVIDLSASTPGVYTVTYTTTGVCSNSSNETVTITSLDDASFNYSAASYCVSGTDPTPTITGVTGGTFSSTTGLSIDPSTGVIDVSASTPGTYTVTYTTLGLCSNSSNTSITINALDDASFSYSSANYCVNATDPTPTITGVTGGTFISTAGLSIDSSTGVIDVSASTPGTYTVTYTTSGACPNSSSTSVTIDAVDDASFNYSVASYCVDASDPTPTITGLTGGTFSSTTGLSIDPSTGVIDVSASTPGTYSVTYTTSGSCPNSSSTSITINALDDASFSYSSANYCVNATDPAPTITGVTGGTFSSTAGLSIDPSAGIIDVSASTPGTYTVTYTTSGSCPNSSDVLVTINALDDPSFTMTPSCDGGTATVLGTTGGTFAFQTTPSDGATIDPVTGTISNGSSGGNYSVTYTTAGVCPMSSSENVTALLSPEIDPIVDQTVCDQYVLPVITGNNLSGNENFYNDSQANGGTILIGPITSTQTVYVYDSNLGCSDEISFLVTVNVTDDPSFTLTDFCEGSSNGAVVTGTPGGTFAIVSPIADGATINGSTGEISDGVGGTTYTVSYTTNGACPASSMQTVMVNPLPSEPVVSADETACIGDTLAPLTATGTNLTWYDDATLSNVIGTGGIYTPSVTTEGTYYYYVTQSVNGCESPAADVTVIIESCDIVVPTAFTPNGDGAHDDWEIPNIDVMFPNNIVRVYNRWGNLVFESEQGDYDSNRWDGTYKGELLPVGSYYFIIELNDGHSEPKTGTVSIILD